ncbi:MAG: L-fucose mutarotase [Lachnospiraceae bacterium]|nr:L-fucose mutarotase [Lachnospiraceae bacterium]
MLKGVPSILSPELLKIMMEMGHGDEIVIADGNFPGAGLAKRLIRLDGHGVPEIMSAILKLMPLDTYADPVFLMEKVPGDTVETPIWEIYKRIASEHTSADVKYIERFEFYERAKKAYAVVMSGETALYANVILKKGVVAE